MLPVENWVPMCWPRAWQDAGPLALLQGSPVNCIILDWSDSEGARAIAGGHMKQASRRSG